MTNQEKKLWLMQYRGILDDIDDLIRERKTWKDRAERITAQISGMPGGGGDERGGEEAILQIAEISAEIDRQTVAARARRREIRTCIGRLKDQRLRRLLRLRYIDGHSFDRIADEMHYSWRWVLKLHGQALDQLRVKEDMEVHIRDVL